LIDTYSTTCVLAITSLDLDAISAFELIVEEKFCLSFLMCCVTRTS